MRPTAPLAGLSGPAARPVPFRAAWRWIAAALCGLALLHPGPAAARPLTVGATDIAMLVWIAEERGYFKEQGLDIDIRTFQAGMAAANEVIDGKIDISTTADAAFVNQSFTHPDLRILAVISTSDTAQLIGRRDHGVLEAADLAGKRIGVTLGTTGEYLLSRYLIMHGVPESAPVLIDLPPAAIASSLVSGEIDAGLTWEPYIRGAELALRDNARPLPAQVDQSYYFMLLTTQSWLDRNPKKVVLFLKALIDAEKFCIDHPAAAKKIIKDKYNYNQEYVDYIWRLQDLHISLPQGLMFVLERQADWQIRHRRTTARTPPSFLDVIAIDPLASLRETSVEIVK